MIYSYKGSRIVASSKAEAISKIISAKSKELFTIKMYFNKDSKEWRPVAVINDGSNMIVDWDDDAFGNIKWYVSEVTPSYVKSFKKLDYAKVKSFTSKSNHSVASLEQFVNNWINKNK
jgi:hypothetical protein